MIGDESIKDTKDIFFFGPKLRFEFSEKGSVQISTLSNDEPSRILAQLNNSEWEELVWRQRNAKESAEDKTEIVEACDSEVDPEPEEAEYRRAIVLSTGHLTEATAQLGDRAGFEKDPVLFPWTYGYLAYAYQERTDLYHIPDDLWACCVWANEQKLEPEEPVYIFFDQDGPQVEGLPYYDW